MANMSLESSIYIFSSIMISLMPQAAHFEIARFPVRPTDVRYTVNERWLSILQA